MKKTITICDRCKREYKPQTASESAKNPRMYGFGEVELDGNTNYLYNTDLCDECYGELIKWWEKYDFVVTETYDDVAPEFGNWNHKQNVGGEDGEY